MNDIQTAREELDSHIREYIAQQCPEYIVTGWVLACSAINPANDDGTTSYIRTKQNGLPFHSELGLLANAQYDMQHPDDDD